ncbi:hypothetical protein A7982_13096 [Minicystis rosea]|nr:hypothetical protein A7982_13096 [Minicystis rosea]
MFGVAPVQAAQSAVSFYNYFSASGHTGFEALGTSNLFFYRNTGNSILSLVVEHGIDLDSSGQDQPESHVIMNFAGVPGAASLALSDDMGDASTPLPGVVHGNWHFQSNSDGAVIAGLPIPGTWSILVASQFLQGITAYRWVKDDGTTVSFDLGTSVILTAFNSPSSCRKDCSIPICGDGVLDGGEVCDDGNTVGGDGCAANCKSLQ